MAPLLVVLYFGGAALWAAALFIALAGIHEFCNGWKNTGVRPSATICYVMTAALFLNAIPAGESAVPEFYSNMMRITVWLFLAVAVSLIYGWRITERGPYDSAATVTALVYIPFFAYHMVLIDLTEYRLFIWIVVISAFGSDIFAYFTGVLFGKHRMAPNLSPKKTLEGAAGGLIGAALLSWLFGYIFMREYAAVCLLLGFAGGLAGMAGDLTASAFKRQMGIKDYGRLIPGHGGILDRFDSIIFTAPVIYYGICGITDILGI